MQLPQKIVSQWSTGSCLFGELGPVWLFSLEASWPAPCSLPAAHKKPCHLRRGFSVFCFLFLSASRELANFFDHEPDPNQDDDGIY